MRYFFDVVGGADTTRDEIGRELSHPEEIRRVALETLIPIFHDEVLADAVSNMEISVSDEQGRCVLRIGLRLDIAWNVRPGA